MARIKFKLNLKKYILKIFNKRSDSVLKAGNSGWRGKKSLKSWEIKKLKKNLILGLEYDENKVWTNEKKESFWKF